MKSSYPIYKPSQYGNWMNIEDACAKYRLSKSTFYTKVRGFVETRVSNRSVEYLITDYVKKILKTDLRSLMYTDSKNKYKENVKFDLKGYMPKHDVIKKCGTDLRTILRRLKRYNIPFETKRIGHKLYFKEFTPLEFRLLMYRNLKSEDIKAVFEEKQNTKLYKKEPSKEDKEKKSEIPTLEGCIRLEDLNKKIGTTDGIICGFISKLKIKPKFVNTPEGKDPQFEKKYIKIFKNLLQVEKEE